MARISVIVPVYKVEKYLAKCVDSLLVQTFTDFELILVDDGSPDRCGEICDDYAAKDSRVHVIHRENGGLSAARNSALDWIFMNGSGDWVTFVDSDDWVDRRYLELLYTAAIDNGADVSACLFQLVPGEDKPHRGVVVMAPEQFWTRDYLTATIACAKLYRKALFEKIRYPVGKVHEDEYVTYRILFQLDSMPVVMAPLYYYFRHQGSLSIDYFSAGALDKRPAYRAQIAFFNERGCFDAYASTLVRYLNFLARYIVSWEKVAVRPFDIPFAEMRDEFMRYYNEGKKRVSFPWYRNYDMHRLLHPVRARFYRPFIRLFGAIERRGVGGFIMCAMKRYMRFKS